MRSGRGQTNVESVRARSEGRPAASDSTRSAARALRDRSGTTKRPANGARTRSCEGPPAGPLQASQGTIRGVRRTRLLRRRCGPVLPSGRRPAVVRSLCEEPFGVREGARPSETGTSSAWMPEVPPHSRGWSGLMRRRIPRPRRRTSRRPKSGSDCNRARAARTASWAPSRDRPARGKWRSASALRAPSRAC